MNVWKISEMMDFRRFVGPLLHTFIPPKIESGENIGHGRIMMFYFGKVKSPYDGWSKTILNEKTRMIFLHSCIHYKCHLALWFSFILYFSQQKWIPFPKNKVLAALLLIDLKMEVGLLSNSTNWKKTLSETNFLTN